jgi:hypothetical protein
VNIHTVAATMCAAVRALVLADLESTDFLSVKVTVVVRVVVGPPTI